MKTKFKVLLSIVIFLIALFYIFSPPRHLSIKITANPVGVQEFYVEVHSSRPNFHGRTVKRIYSGMVSINQKVKLPLDQSKILWRGHIGVQVSHPEFFRDSASANNHYFLPGVNFSPSPWKTILDRSPIWSIDSSTANTGLSQQEINSALTNHLLLTPHHAVHHISKFNHVYLDYYLQSSDKNNLRKSIEIIDRLFDQCNKSLKQSDIAPSVSKRWMKKQLDLMTNSYKEIHEKVN